MRGVVVAVAAACVGLALPAAAEEAGGARVVSVTDGDRVQGTLAVQVEAHSSKGISRLRLFIDNRGVAEERYEEPPENASLVYSWDTAVAVGLSSPSRNGSYDVVVEAVATDGARYEETIEVFVDNPPATPSGMTARLGGGTAKLFWNPNREPDLAGYQVQRDGGRGFVTIGTAAGSAYTDTAARLSYVYRVIAIRAGGTGGERLSSPSAPVTLAAPSSPPSSGASRGGASPSSGPGGGASGWARRGAIRDVGASGLPSGTPLRGVAGFPRLPQLQAVEYGTFDKRLPYDLSQRRGPVQVEPLGEPVQAASYAVIPSDGLRWVALGALLLAAAGLLALFARLLEPHPHGTGRVGQGAARRHRGPRPVKPRRRAPSRFPID